MTAISPNEISIGAFVTSGLISSLLVAMLFMSLSLLSGMLLSTQVTLVSTRWSIGKNHIEKTSAMNLVAAVGIFLVNITLIYFIFAQWVHTNVIPFYFAISLLERFLWSQNLASDWKLVRND